MANFEYENIIKKVNIEWLPFFEENKEDFQKILTELNTMTKKIYPKPKDLLRSLFYHSPNDIKLFLLGQDPYIGEENTLPQAMGLSFSVPKKHKKIPPSLQNIFKEIKNSYPDYNIPKHGLLKRWARQEKILLLNAALTVFEKDSNSHAKLWFNFINKLIKWFQDKNDGCIFLLMGNFAQTKKAFIDEKKHKIFSTVHPSPLSAHNGFFKCNVFKQINDYLEEKDKDIIIW
jgi:uracil-DNA glycosylase